MWRKLKKVMVKNGVPNPNFKGFIADDIWANWNIVQIVYGIGDPSELMVDREKTWFFHSNQILDRQNNKSS
jgi:hypothetical protein